MQTLRNTWEIIKTCWHVLKLDKELIAFPILSTLGAIVIGAVLLGGFGASGRFDDLSNVQWGAGDVIGALAAYFLALYVVIFCNAALIAAARERLEGGDPTVGSGFRAVAPMWLAILGWTLITGTVGLILNALQSAANDNSSGVARIAAMILISIVGAVWAYITFFTVPVLVVERMGPIAAIRRSAGLLRQSWGEQLAAGFSFFLAYLAAGVIVAIPAVLVGFANVFAGIGVAVILGGLAFGMVATLEGIFKAALYEWVTAGKGSEWFDERLLRGAYAPKPERSWGA